LAQDLISPANEWGRFFTRTLGELIMKTVKWLGCVVALAAVLNGGRADAAGLLVADGGLGGVLEIKEQTVRVTINNGVAVTDVEQVFLNTENRVVEALYTFPVPKNASVANFSMWIAGKEMIGEVVEKERARQIYESYKQVRRDPGLLEQVDYKTFEMRIFPIPAGAEQRVKVTYYQELDFDHDWATYVYPLATVTRTGIDQRTTGKFALTLDVKSEAPIVQIESPSHRDDFVMVNHAPQYAQASLETDGGDLSRDLVIAYKIARPRTGLDLIASKRSSEDGFFQLTLTAGEELAELNQGMDYVFILDVSGSMANDGKLGLSRGSVFAFIESLGPEDRFEVITFNMAANPLFKDLRQVGEESKSEALTFLERQRAAGGTVLRPALSTAYRYQDSDRTLNVVVLSDGMTEQNEQRELLQLIQERPSGSRVFCIGVGNEVNRPLLSQLAEGAGGLAAFVSQGDDFQRQAEAFRRKLMRPAMRNIRLDFAGAAVYDVEPQTLPDLFHGSPLRVYGRYKKAGPVAVTLAADVQGAPIKQTVELKLPENDANNPEIERMWASGRVERLLAEERAAGAEKHKNEIVQLCEGFSIVSPYASFLVLENDAEYQRWKIDRRNALRIEADRAAQELVRKELARLRDQAVANLGPQPAAEATSAATRLPANTTSTGPAPGVAPSPTELAASPGSGNNRDLQLPSFNGGGGGGAVDPLTGALAIALAGAAAAAARRRKA
jgi:Ca-activated chloride channel family protein